MTKNILIVDDEALVTKSLKRLLKKEGFNVVVAESGQEALDKVKEMDFDLVVSDVRMPAMDGIEVIKKIRDELRQKGKAPVPEILITGYADEDRYENAVDLKVADYIYKPFDTTEFLATVKKHLSS